MARMTKLGELLLQWEDRQRQGKPVVLEDLCRSVPELQSEVRQRIQALEAMDAVLQSDNRTAPHPASAKVSKVKNTRYDELYPGSELLPGYRLVERIGQGGFAEVWKATGPGGFSVALKLIVLSRKISATELKSLEILKQIRHPNLLTPFGSWETKGFLIIGMPLANCSLFDRFTEVQKQSSAGIPQTELFEYMKQASHGIDYLNKPQHFIDGKKVGIQHRDIKPQNILLIGDGIAISDFGLASILETNLATHTGSLTLAYAPPEFFNGFTSNYSDQYSLAVTYCQLRGGRLPFWGTAGMIMSGHLQHPPDLSMLPVEERPAIQRALSKDPDQRWESCQDFVAAVTEANTSISQQATKIESPDTRRNSPVTLLPAIILNHKGGADRKRSFFGKWLLSIGVFVFPFIAVGVFLLNQTNSKNDIDPKGANAKSSAKSQPTENGPFVPKGTLTKEFTNAIGMRFVLVPGGTFWMSQDGRNAVKQVTVPHDFYMGVFEVTQEEWQKVMGYNPSKFSRLGEEASKVATIPDEELKRFPVEMISRSEIDVFVQKLNANPKEAGGVYRLPTETEWEFACRGASTLKEDCSFDYYLEQPTLSLTPKNANYGLQPQRTCKVGSYPPNRLGIYDMHGNLWEWTKDRYDPILWVVRGGAWHSKTTEFCTASYRGKHGDAPGANIGFRLVLVPTIGKQNVIPKQITNSIGMRLVPIPAGKFFMGSPVKEAGRNIYDESPLHIVEITQPFFMGVYEVTQEEYEKVMGKNPSWFSSHGNGKEKVQGIDTSRFPVEQVSWEDAVEFCRKLSSLPPEKENGRVYTLPTEAQWEYACRAGSPKYQVFHFGDSLSSNQANFDGKKPYGGAAAGPSLGRPTTVGSYTDNAFGLYDMHGNVWEWCQDWYDKMYYKKGQKRDPKGPSKGSLRTFKGGSWNFAGWFCRSANRSYTAPSSHPNDIGFRVVTIKMK
jgi:formylglycine-generating enzyme required for sulfatase activity